ncbi:MAG: hypothetical protein GX224_04380 [Thermoplasmatales archaeon]|nr:hypothetical protein [Thermoplasmatales archaeon]
MYNPEKDFNRLVMDCLGKDGKSISALSKELEGKNVKLHRLILTGYLRALADLNYLREREIPPAKIYQPIRSLPDNIYESVEKSARKLSDDADELILYTLYKLLKRPIFDSELKQAGVNRPIGRKASEYEVGECRRVLRRAGNVVPTNVAVHPEAEYEAEYAEVLADIVLEAKESRYLVLETRQTRLTF